MPPSLYYTAEEWAQLQERIAETVRARHTQRERSGFLGQESFKLKHWIEQDQRDRDFKMDEGL